MKTVIVGPGAIGCLFAGLLANAGNDVRLLDKNDDRARLIAKRGLRIEDAGGTRAVNVKISSDPAGIGRADLVFICVKSYDTGSAIRHSLPLIGKETVVVPLSNGSGNVEKISEAVEDDQIVCGITSQGSTSLGPGYLRHAGAGETVLAAFMPSRRGLAERVARVLAGAGMESRVSDDMQGIIWSKLIISAAINPVTVIFEIPNNQLLTNPEAGDMMRRAAWEAAAVAHAKGVSPTYSDAVKEAETVCRNTARNISSMLQDIRNGRRTEIEAITGVIVKEARAAGVPVPVNEMLLARVLEKQARKGT